MPTYTYSCKSCGSEFDVQQSIKDDTLTTYLCPNEQTEQAVAKLFRPVGVTFKGTGFYKTDSRQSSSGTKRSGSSAGSSDSAGSSGSSSDSDSASSSPASSDSTTSPSTSVPSKPSDSGSTSSSGTDKAASKP